MVIVRSKQRTHCRAWAQRWFWNRFQLLNPVYFFNLPHPAMLRRELLKALHLGIIPSSTQRKWDALHALLLLWILIPVFNHDQIIFLFTWRWMELSNLSCLSLWGLTLAPIFQQRLLLLVEVIVKGSFLSCPRIILLPWFSICCLLHTLEVLQWTWLRIVPIFNTTLMSEVFQSHIVSTDVGLMWHRTSDRTWCLHHGRAFPRGLHVRWTQSFSEPLLSSFFTPYPFLHDPIKPKAHSLSVGFHGTYLGYSFSWSVQRDFPAGQFLGMVLWMMMHILNVNLKYQAPLNPSKFMLSCPLDSRERTARCWYVTPVIKATTHSVSSQSWSQYQPMAGNAK